MERPSRAEIFMRTAHLFAERSTCNRGQVGAVLVKDKRIIATGYNGAPPGMPHCTDVGCSKTLHEEIEHFALGDLMGEGGVRQTAESVVRRLKEKITDNGCQRTVHAEANAILYAARHGISTEGTTMYCTHSPCERCVLLLANAGIKHLVWDKPYRATPWELIEQLGIQMTGREYV